MSTPALRSQMKYVQQCLAGGFSTAEIAQALKVTPAYVSQLIAAIKAEAGEVQGAQGTQSAQGTEWKAAPKTHAERIDSLLESIEMKAAVNLERMVASVTNPMQLVKIVQSINGTKRRSSPQEFGGAQAGASKSGNTVHIHLPQQARAQFVFSSSMEAIEVRTVTEEGTVSRPLVSASKDQLANLAALRQEELNERRILENRALGVEDLSS